MMVAYIILFLQEILPTYSEQEIKDLFVDSLARMAEQKQESVPRVIHEIDGKRIIIQRVLKYNMIGIDVESDKNKPREKLTIE
ncbi:hypothetical protein [Brevibacillus laterosporus]|nr:hypothetical protein [Brevibacillus laterosporus]MED1666610.1 hypothetical protein [Brevibacillus laterosporus]MED1670173.1 hypothetical protein [Brevibacillus laterosporus]MED1718878.1 hypothetical protein [Brevibacillus laterosporus]